MTEEEMKNKKDKLMDEWLRLVDTIGKSYLNLRDDSTSYEFSYSKKVVSMKYVNMHMKKY